MGRYQVRKDTGTQVPTYFGKDSIDIRRCENWGGLRRRAIPPRLKSRGLSRNWMKIRDRKLKETVDVCDRDWLQKSCYWPRPDPGSFVQGRGYRSNGNQGWVCGTRHAHGCPLTFEERS
jgi:hypothetical protein